MIKRCWRIVLTDGRACSMINDEPINKIKALSFAIHRFGEKVDFVE